MLEFLFRNFWLLAIGVGILNYFLIRRNVRQYIKEDPSRESGYEQYLTYLLLFLVLPWVLMGAGILSGEMNTVFDALNPRNGPWIVQVFWGLIGSLFLVHAVWVIRGPGAEFYENHPGLLRINIPGIDSERPTARQIRWIWTIMTLIVALIFFISFSTSDGPFSNMERSPGHSR